MWTFVARGGTFCSSTNFLKFENLSKFRSSIAFSDYIQVKNVCFKQRSIFTTINSDLEEMTAELTAAELQPGKIFDNIELENSNCSIVLNNEDSNRLSEGNVLAAKKPKGNLKWQSGSKGE